LQHLGEHTGYRNNEIANDVLESGDNYAFIYRAPFNHGVIMHLDQEPRIHRHFVGQLVLDLTTSSSNKFPMASDQRTSCRAIMLTLALASSLAIRPAVALPGARMVRTFCVPIWNGLQVLIGTGRSTADLSQDAWREETPCMLLGKPQTEMSLLYGRVFYLQCRTSAARSHVVRRVSVVNSSNAYNIKRQ